MAAEEEQQQEENEDNSRNNSDEDEQGLPIPSSKQRFLKWIESLGDGKAWDHITVTKRLLSSMKGLWNPESDHPLSYAFAQALMDDPEYKTKVAQTKGNVQVIKGGLQRFLLDHDPFVLAQYYLSDKQPAIFLDQLVKGELDGLRDQFPFSTIDKPEENFFDLRQVRPHCISTSEAAAYIMPCSSRDFFCAFRSNKLFSTSSSGILNWRAKFRLKAPRKSPSRSQLPSKRIQLRRKLLKKKPPSQSLRRKLWMQKNKRRSRLNLCRRRELCRQSRNPAGTSSLELLKQR